MSNTKTNSIVASLIRLGAGVTSAAYMAWNYLNRNNNSEAQGDAPTNQDADATPKPDSKINKVDNVSSNGAQISLKTKKVRLLDYSGQLCIPRKPESLQQKDASTVLFFPKTNDLPEVVVVFIPSGTYRRSIMENGIFCFGKVIAGDIEIKAHVLVILSENSEVSYRFSISRAR